MSLLTSSSILPFGTQIHPVAKGTNKPSPPPSAYNANYLKTPIKTVVPSPGVGGPIWGRNPTHDGVNLPISEKIIRQSPPPSAYNANYLKSPSTLTVPAPIPLTRDYIHSQFSGSGPSDPSKATPGGPEQTAREMDPLNLAQVMAKATKGTVNHRFWLEALALLTKLRVITINRPLTQTEKGQMATLINLMQERATNLTPDEPLGVNPQPLN